MGGKISRPTKEFIDSLEYRDSPTLDKPLTLEDGKSVSTTATQFYAKLYEVRHVSWDRGGAFFHQLFDFYKKYPKLQVEFLTQTLMQLRKNPHKQYELKLHWVLMEFLFHGRNHLLVNEILCLFYRDVIAEATKKIEEIEKHTDQETNCCSMEASSSSLHHPRRIRATAEYTLVNLQDIIDYGSHSGCVGGSPKWLVVELHDARGISYHRKVIRYKLYERKARYVDTVAQEFGFADPNRSELFVVYTDARKTSYRVNYGHDMLRPDEELRYDLDWTDCYFIYKAQDTPLRDNRGNIVKIPDDNGQVFFLCNLPEGKLAEVLAARPSESEGRGASARSKAERRRQSTVRNRNSAIQGKTSSPHSIFREMMEGSNDTASSRTTKRAATGALAEGGVASGVTEGNKATVPQGDDDSTCSGSPETSGGPGGSPFDDAQDDDQRSIAESADFATPTASRMEDDDETMILYKGNRIVK